MCVCLHEFMCITCGQEATEAKRGCVITEVAVSCELPCGTRHQACSSTQTHMQKKIHKHKIKTFSKHTNASTSTLHLRLRAKILYTPDLSVQLHPPTHSWLSDSKPDLKFHLAAGCKWQLSRASTIFLENMF